MPVDKLTPTFTFTEDRLQALQAVVPEAFADGQVNWETLKEALGAYLADEGPGTEHFGLFWPGKRQARRLAAQPSKGTLRPVKGQGVNEASTRNLFIEGDNLEVLKLLQKSYAGRVKLIYIDPPYNTGTDFVYKDDFREPLDSYLRKSGQADAEGLLTSNPKAGGRFHSNWLNMMLPRLMLARTLLSEDGVIFVSIDDNEVANLRQMMDEVFGEENFVDFFNWVKTETPANLSKKSKKIIEYILCYQKVKNDEKFHGVKKDSPASNGLLNQTNRIGILKFPANTVLTKIPNGTLQKGIYGTESYEINLMEDTEIGNGVFIKPVVLQARLKWTQSKLEQELNLGTIISIPTVKLSPSYERKEYEAESPPNLINSKVGVGTNENGGTLLESLLSGKFFDYPKPPSLIKYLACFSNKKDALVMDFFSGSCTTAQAVLELNREDGGNRRFIMVQMPEPTPKDSAAHQAGYQTIADIGKERIRRVIKKLADSPQAELIEKRDTAEDLGFAVYKLDRSHFKAWQDYDGPPDPAALDDLFSRFEDPLIDGWQPRALLDEVLLLQGFPLDSQRTRLKDFQHNAIVHVECEWFSFRLFVCLDATLQPATIAQLQLQADDKFICLDSALTDQLRQQLADRCKLTVL